MFYADQFRIRCSSIHRIMANMKEPGLTDKEKHELRELEDCRDGKLLTPTGKVAGFTVKRKERLAELENERDNPTPVDLPQGAKTVCEEYVRARCWKRRKGFTASSTEKGTRTEEDGIELLRQYLDDEFLEKNEERVTTEYIEGESDLNAPYALIDVKSIETPFTMPVWKLEPPKVYHDQLQGYGFLYGKENLWLAYTLNNAPEDMIEREARIKCRTQYGPDYTYEEYAEILERTTAQKTYDDLPMALRVRIIKFKYDPSFIESVIERVKMCRGYISKLESELPEDVKTELYYRFKKEGKVCHFKPYSLILPETAQSERA